MYKLSLIDKYYSLQICSLLVYKHFLKRKEVNLQDITLSLAIRDWSIQEGGLFKRAVSSRAYGIPKKFCQKTLTHYIGYHMSQNGGLLISWPDFCIKVLCSFFD